MNLNNENTNLESSLPRKTRGRENSDRNLNIYFPIISVILWAGLLYGGYILASNYFQESHAVINEKIEEVKVQNEANLAELTRFNEELQASREQLVLINEELNYLKEALQITGESITGSDATRVAIEARMKELDKQLSQLKTQLVKLEEAARAH